jgi:hypothetical protein
MSKTRADAKLKTLPAEVQEAMWVFFNEDPTRTLADAVPWLKSEHDVTTSVQRLSEWRGWYERRKFIDDANSEAEELAELLSKPGCTLTPAQIEGITNAVFLNRASKAGDLEVFKVSAAIVQRAQELRANQAAHEDKMRVAEKKLELQRRELERKLKELEIKLAAARAEVEKESKLTAEEQRERLRAILK